MNQPLRTLHALLLPHTTNRETTSLIVVVPDYNAHTEVHEAVPGNLCTDLRRTPPVSIGANVVECPIVAIGATDTTRKA